MSGEICAKCGGYKWHYPPEQTVSSGINICHCKANEPLEGWRCPVCGAVYAPWVAMCGNPHTKTIVSSSSTLVPPWFQGDE